jgi:hypothetical protein
MVCAYMMTQAVLLYQRPPNLYYLLLDITPSPQLVQTVIVYVWLWDHEPCSFSVAMPEMKLHVLILGQKTWEEIFRDVGRTN